jgi:hypothetical protein
VAVSQSQNDKELLPNCEPCAQQRARSEGTVGGGGLGGQPSGLVPYPVSPLVPVVQPSGVNVPQESTGSDAPDITPVEEGQGAEGPVSKCGPRIGYVALAGEDFEKVQAYVDRGGNPWRLDPVQTARVVGAAKLGFSQNDRFWLRGTYVDAGSGLNHALVWATHKTCVYQIECYQPVRQGKGGIWAVERVNEMETRSIRF